MAQEYLYESVGTTITNYGDGRLLLLFEQPAKDIIQVNMQAIWVKETIADLHAKYLKQKFFLLIDLEKLMTIQLDAAAIATYAAIIAQSFFSKIAFVGDAVNYGRVTPLIINPKLGKKRMRFFFRMDEAKVWLKW